MRRHRGWLLAGAFALLVTGCDAQSGATDPTPSTSSVPSTLSPSPSARTQQQQDTDAAIAAYRAAWAEQARLAASGGATKSTPALRRSASSTYLDFLVKNLTLIHKEGAHLEGQPILLGTSSVVWASSRITFDGCEDWSATELVVGSRKLHAAGTKKYIQHLIATPSGDGTWRVSAQTSTTQVKDISSRTCSKGFG